MANFTFHTTADSTPLSCVFDENFVTAHGGYSFIASVLRRRDFFRPLIDVLDKELPRTYPFYLYTNEDIIEQLMAGLIIGLPRFSDADQMKRTLIYTTNSIEGLNRAIRKVIKPRTLFPSEDAARKLIYLAIRNYTETWTHASTRWSSAMPQFALLFGERFTNAME